MARYVEVWEGGEVWWRFGQVVVRCGERWARYGEVWEGVVRFGQVW